MSQTEKQRQYCRDYARRKRDAEAKIKRPNKCQCLVCGGWYVQVGSHVVGAHGYKTCRQYREEFGLDVKKGITAEPYRKRKEDDARENGTIENLKKGAKYRFRKGQLGVGVYKRSEQTKKKLEKARAARFKNKSKKDE